MDRLIPVINKVQEAFSAIGKSLSLDLPQIVVIGSQSSGKSSILENLVGRDFLPRGTGIVTRLPLILQLYNILPGINASVQEWGEFGHISGKIFHDFTEIQQEILRETERRVGRNKNVSSEPILLKIYSSRVITLTLIDLPGLTKVVVGDQPKDISEKIESMVLEFISNPNSIILAVSPGNDDLANSESLKIAQKADPQRKRTLGVITKLDIMNQGTNARDILTGKVIPLEMGYIGVVNRNQKDTIEGKSIQRAIEDEKKFFNSRPEYASIAGRCSIKVLSETLNKILRRHIFETLPALKEKIQRQLNGLNEEYSSYGIPLSSRDNRIFLFNILNEYSETFRKSIEGELINQSKIEVDGGARILVLFQELISFANKIDPVSSLSSDDITNAIFNSSGVASPLFIPESAFLLLTKSMIKQLEDLAFNCLDLCFKELELIIKLVLNDVKYDRFPHLKRKILDISLLNVSECKNPCRKSIKNMFLIEYAYINTHHPDFIAQIENSLVIPPVIVTSLPDEELSVTVIELLSSYFNIVRKNIVDIIPKAIAKHIRILIQQIKDSLVQELYNSEELTEYLMSEENDITEKRRACQERISDLRKANSILQSLRM